MKIETLLTIRCTPETRDEAIHQFAAVYEEFRGEIEAKVAQEHAIEVPHTTQIRWVLNLPRWE